MLGINKWKINRLVTKTRGRERAQKDEPLIVCPPHPQTSSVGSDGVLGGGNCGGREEEEIG